MAEMRGPDAQPCASHRGALRLVYCMGNKSEDMETPERCSACPSVWLPRSLGGGVNLLLLLVVPTCYHPQDRPPTRTYFSASSDLFFRFQRPVVDCSHVLPSSRSPTRMKYTVRFALSHRASTTRVYLLTSLVGKVLPSASLSPAARAFSRPFSPSRPTSPSNSQQAGRPPRDLFFSLQTYLPVQLPAGRAFSRPIFLPPDLPPCPTPSRPSNSQQASRRNPRDRDFVELLCSCRIWSPTAPRPGLPGASRARSRTVPLPAGRVFFSPHLPPRP